MKGYFFVLTSPILLPDFTNEKKLSLKKLPTPGLDGFGVIYVYNEESELIFLYSDGKRNAIRYDIEKDEHRVIQSSNSIDVHGNGPISLRMGSLLWIIGGQNQLYSSMPIYEPQFTTALWVQFSFFRIRLTKG